MNYDLLDRAGTTTRAFIDDLGVHGLSVVMNADGLSAMTGLGGGEGDDVVVSGVGPAAGAEARVVVGHVTREGEDRGCDEADGGD